MSADPARMPEPATLAAMAEEFFREGSVLVPGLLSPDEAARLRGATERHAADPAIDPRHLDGNTGTLVLRRCHELDPLYAAMVTHPPIVAIAEAVLGPDARFNAMNVIRSEPGTAISRWHVDDVLEFPLPPEIPRFDPRIRMPVLWMTVQIALTDIETEAHGPTQFVPGSHYSGRLPSTREEPRFEGRGPVSILCRAGDAYLTNHQCWHRGAPNESDRVRCVMQVQYARRWADRRFRGLA